MALIFCGGWVGLFLWGFWFFTPFITLAFHYVTQNQRPTLLRFFFFINIYLWWWCSSNHTPYNFFHHHVFKITLICFKSILEVFFCSFIIYFLRYCFFYFCFYLVFFLVLFQMLMKKVQFNLDNVFII